MKRIAVFMFTLLTACSSSNDSPSGPGQPGITPVVLADAFTLTGQDTVTLNYNTPFRLVVFGPYNLTDFDSVALTLTEQSLDSSHTTIAVFGVQNDGVPTNYRTLSIDTLRATPDTTRVVAHDYHFADPTKGMFKVEVSSGIGFFSDPTLLGWRRP